MSLDLLFHPFTIQNLKIANRIIMAPMTRSKSPNHIPTKEVADYYERRAKGGVGLIITEGTVINHKAGHGYPDVPNIMVRCFKGLERSGKASSYRRWINIPATVACGKRASENTTLKSRGR